MSDRFLYGIANTPRLRRIESPHCKALQTFPAGCSAPPWVPLLVAHRKRLIIGHVIGLWPTPTALYALAHVYNRGYSREAWPLIESGLMRSFSIRYSGKCVDPSAPVWRIERWKLTELSVCEKPGNPDCAFEIVSQSRAIEICEAHKRGSHVR